jgi:hypothetical protein
LYFFYDNSAAATSGHFTVNGVVQAAGISKAAAATNGQRNRIAGFVLKRMLRQRVSARRLLADRDVHRPVRHPSTCRVAAAEGIAR